MARMLKIRHAVRDLQARIAKAVRQGRETLTAGESTRLKALVKKPEVVEWRVGTDLGPEITNMTVTAIYWRMSSLCKRADQAVDEAAKQATKLRSEKAKAKYEQGACEPFTLLSGPPSRLALRS